MEITPRLEIGVRRVMAWLVDVGLALAWAGLVAGAALLTSPWHLGPVARNVAAFALVIAPVRLALAVAEGRDATQASGSPAWSSSTRTSRSRSASVAPWSAPR